MNSPQEYEFHKCVIWMWFNSISIITVGYTWLRFCKSKNAKKSDQCQPSGARAQSDASPRPPFDFHILWQLATLRDCWPKVSLFWSSIGMARALSTCIRSFQLNAWNASTPATDQPIPNSHSQLIPVSGSIGASNKPGKVIRINWPWTLFPVDLLADISVQIHAVHI